MKTFSSGWALLGTRIKPGVNWMRGYERVTFHSRSCHVNISCPTLVTWNYIPATLKEYLGWQSLLDDFTLQKQGQIHAFINTVCMSSTLLSFDIFVLQSALTNVLTVDKMCVLKVLARRSFNTYFIVRRAGLLWSQQDFEWLWSVPLSSASLY